MKRGFLKPIVALVALFFAIAMLKHFANSYHQSKLDRNLDELRRSQQELDNALRKIER